MLHYNNNKYKTEIKESAKNVGEVINPPGKLHVLNACCKVKEGKVLVVRCHASFLTFWQIFEFEFEKKKKKRAVFWNVVWMHNGILHACSRVAVCFVSLPLLPLLHLQRRTHGWMNILDKNKLYIYKFYNCIFLASITHTFNTKYMATNHVASKRLLHYVL